jgi:putative ABC transport system substrate-binding protein
MRRREFITLLGGAAVVSWPLAARAQQATPNIPPVGFLALPNSGVKEIQQGLHALGYIEGQNIAFEVLSEQGRLERLRELGAELVRHNVAVIVTGT